MKKILLFLLAIVLCVTACHKNYEINTIPQFNKCLAPTDVKAKVLYMNVTFDWRVYGDAEYYDLEIYSAVPAEGEEPDPDALVDRLKITPEMLPYTYRGPEDKKLYYRVKAVREGREDSRWVSGTCVTDVDPTTTCSLPTNVKVVAICDMVIFTWDVYPNTKAYEVEVYDDAIPAEGDPAPETLVKTISVEPTHVPDTVMFEPNQKLYYRLRGTAPETDLKPSKWVKGSFSTTEFIRPVDEHALNSTVTQNYKLEDIDGNPSPFTGTGATQPVDAVVTLSDGFTYAYKCMYYGNRVTLPTGLVTDLNSDYGASIPTKDYVSFKVCKPGTMENYFAAAAATAEACVVLLTNKEGEGKKARILYKGTDLPVTATVGTLTKTKINIKESDLYGIKEAATVYAFSSNRKGLHVFQITWTPAP